MKDLELIHPDMPALVDSLLQLRGWSWEQASAGEAIHAGKKYSLAEIQEALIYGDPVLFVETHLIEQPDNRSPDGGMTWRLYEYQKPSLRWPGNAVHQDAAEVGKTREIVALVLWNALIKGSVLVGAPLSGHLEEIREEMEYQLSANPILRALQTKKSRVKPYGRFTLNFDVDLRPGGIAGEAFRGVHASALAIFDEGATVQNPRVFSEFMRAKKPKARSRFYSVPNGVQTTPYSKLKAKATEFEPIMISMEPQDIVRSALGLQSRHRGDLTPVQRLARESNKGVYVRFHWPKCIMAGTPFWNEDRRQTYIEDFGGADTPGYIHNVLGLDGDPADAVFPWAVLERNLATLDGYRRVSFGFDRHDQRIDVEVWRPNPAFGPDGEAAEALALQSRERLDLDQLEGQSEAEREAELERIFRAEIPDPQGGLGLVAGVDVGQHVTAINFARVAGESFPPTLSLVARVALRGADGVWQRLAIRALDAVISPAWGWGLDTTGIGAGLFAELRSTADSHQFDERLGAFTFNMRLPQIDPKTGEQVLSPDGKPRFVLTKELGTLLLESVFGRAAFLIPRDDELLHQFQSQVVVLSKNGTRHVSKGNDHDTDSFRCLMLRLYERRFFGTGFTGPIVFHTPPNADSGAGALPSQFDRGTATGGLLEGY